MRESEFWECVYSALGRDLGPSLITDLYLPAYGATAEEALASAVDRQKLWDEVCRELDLPEEARWFHRRKRKGKGKA